MTDQDKLPSRPLRHEPLSPNGKATKRAKGKNTFPATPPPPDLRWQRAIRYNWDKGGSKGGR